MKKGDDSNIEQIINIPDTIQAPINKGDKIGEIVYTIDGMELSRVNIIANESAEKNTIFNMFSHVYKKWGTLLR